MTPTVASVSAPAPVIGRSDTALRAAAEKLEASFLAEMLKAAGVGKPRESYGGGAGEEQFASFLREKQAEAMVQAGGIGLSEALFEALKERVDGQG
jgi:Rod binding domain-containing protein